MTPKQEARLLRAQAAVFREEADELRRHATYETVRSSTLKAAAHECEAVAAELEAQAEAEALKLQSKCEPRDTSDECHDFATQGTSAQGCYGDGHWRCKECIHWLPAQVASCCGKPLGPGETCGDCTNQEGE